MKKFLLFLFLTTLSSFLLNAQKETDHWFFGVSAGLNFTSGAPALECGANVYSIPEGSASISTPAGNLMFYTDGSQVWNSSHQLMPNGTGLHGDISSTQSSIIIPVPATASQYYIFTTGADGDTTGLKYSIVDMTLNGGLGDITSKNIALEDSMTEKLAAIRTDVGGTYWIVAHKSGNDAFYAYQVTAFGVQPPVISHTGIVHSNAAIQYSHGQMKFNMCGTKLGVATAYLDTVQVFDFNMTSGVVSNPLTLAMNDHTYGLEFSPNSNLLYVTTYDISGTLLQYNITLGSQALIEASRTPLSATPDLYALQLASDGKIYVARSFSSTFLGVINSPNTQGSGCTYSENAVNLDTAGNGYSSALGLPGFLQNYLKNALSIVCPGAGMEDEFVNGIGVYPNPSAEEFTIQLNEVGQTLSITVIDNLGQLIETMTISDKEVLFGRDYKPGIYFILISDGQHTKTLKAIKM